MSNLLFTLPLSAKSLTNATKSSVNRRSGTVAETVRHSLVHTQGKVTTLHHCIIGACPHPIRSRAELGDHYMVGYISIPLPWYSKIGKDIVAQHGITFAGPAGTAQRLPTAMYECDELLGDRVYLGFNWLSAAMSEPPLQQPSYTRISQQLLDCVNSVKEQAE